MNKTMKRLLNSKFFVSLTCLLLLMSVLSSFASASTEEDMTATVPFKLAQTGTTFSVTLPASLPVAVDSKGEVTTASNLRIINNSFGPVKVESAQIKPVDGWVISPWGTDYKAKKVGLKEVSFKFNDNEVDTSGAVSTANLRSIVGEGGTLPLTYESDISVQKDRIDNEVIATLLLTVGWDNVGGQTDGENPLPELPQTPEVTPTPTTNPTPTTPPVTPETPVTEFIPDGYVLAQDSDFTFNDELGTYLYTGDDEYVVIPHKIQGNYLDSLTFMFVYASSVKGVAFNSPRPMDMTGVFYSQLVDRQSLDLRYFDTSNAINMNGMFAYYQGSPLDLSHFNTSKVVAMDNMFSFYKGEPLNLSSFDTSNVETMTYMFSGAITPSLDLSVLNTSKVYTMSSLFQEAQIGTINLSGLNTKNLVQTSSMFESTDTDVIDLSSFDFSRLGDSLWMFEDTTATKGYARTAADAKILNETYKKSPNLTFVVK